jgi:hypothetical protein
MKKGSAPIIGDNNYENIINNSSQLEPQQFITSSHPSNSS